MYSSPERFADPDYEGFENSTPRHAGPQSLYQQPATKTCVFYKDGDPNFAGVKLAVNPRYYHNMDILQDELTVKIKDLTNGVRSIHTPGGRHTISRIQDLENQGKYVCSSNKRQAKGLNLNRVGIRPWMAGKPPSGRRRHWPDPYKARRAWTRPRNDADAYPYRNAPKKITVINNVEPSERHVLLLNRRTLQTFEQILNDLSEMFHMPVRRLYTAGGRPVYGLSAIFNGPEMYVVTSGDRFQPISSSMSDPGVSQPAVKLAKRKAYTGDAVHQKQKDRRQKLAQTRGKWKVWVTTNELPSAGTEAQVSITVYGHKSNSGPIPLGYSKGETFQSGNIDEFEISVGIIGEIYKVRIAHDNAGDYPGWFCDEVRMRDIHTGEELVFDCRRWLSRDEEDTEICRELPATRENDSVLPIVCYEVSVTTGDLWNAGTSANVYITMYGERGDTGVRQLYLSQKAEKFLKGQTDVFTVEAVSLGNLRRVIVGHDGTIPGEGWYLDRVTVKESAKSQFEWVFPCSRWLDEGEEDGKIVRELKPQVEYNQDKIEKKLWKFEEWKFQANNQVLLYSKMTQRCVRINPDASVDANGDSTDELGILKVVPKRDLVQVLQSVSFPKCHLGIDSGRVIGQGRGGSFCEFKVRVQQDRSIIFESAKYSNQQLNFLNTGKAGDPRGLTSDPSRQFYVYCKGVFRDQGILMLCTSICQTLNIDHDNMLYATGRRNKLCHFRVHKVSDGNIRMFESVVFPGQFIRITSGKVDCNGTGDHTCHFKVERVKEKGFVCLESLAQRGIYIGMVPDGKVRPTVNTGDVNVRLWPEVIEFGRPKGVEYEPSPPPAETKPRKVRARRPSPSPAQQSPTPTPRRRRRSPTPPTPKPVSPEPDRVESAKSQFDEGDWKLWITSSETAQNADIAMVVYGDKGNSGSIVLGKAGRDGLFKARNQDQFKANLAKVGKIFKIRLELHPGHLDDNPSWKVQEVKMQDMTTRETLKFKFNRWLSRNKDDCDVMREMPAVRPRQDVLKVIKYQIHVYTGDEAGSDTDANVYLTLFGERGDTGKRMLLESRADNRTKFQEGQVDIFELEAVDLGKLKRAVISHDGEGPGEGWYCEQVLVREGLEATYEYIFPCDKWLDTAIEDGKTERVLKVREPAPCPIKFLDDTEDDADIESVDDDYMASLCSSSDSEDEHRPIPKPAENAQTPPPPEDEPEPGEWKVWVTTGSDNNNGTCNEVVLYAYGEDGCSEPVLLGSGQDYQHFQAGNTDEFKVDLGTELGDLYKIRIGHSDADRKSGWYLEKVKMQNLTTEEVFMFKVKRWMWRQEEDCEVWRELPVVRPGQQPLPVLVYTVEVYTGSKPGADTEASVFVQLFGSRGDTGKRLLYKSRTNWSKFQEGQVDVFQVEAVTLEDVEKVLIGHDSKGRGAGWYLDKVIVKESDEPGARMFYFPCDRWLDGGLDDKKIERELYAAEPPKQSTGEYTVWVKTHRDSKPANGSSVIFTAYGEMGKSKDIELTAEKPAFEPGNTDEFQVSLGDIGELYKIRMSRKDKDEWQGWHLNQVKLQDKDTKKETVYKFDRWMDRAQDDHDVVREKAMVKDGKDVLPMQRYEISVYTGDRWAAETDANVYMTMYGSKGDTGKRWLYRSLTQPTKFQRNKTDLFTLEAVTLKDLQRIVIGHDGVGHGAGWFLDKVVVREMEGQETKKLYVFPCGRWLDDSEDDQKTERELRMLDVTEEEKKPTAPKKGSKTQGQWKVRVKTSDLHNAGTHAQVYLTAYGNKGSSECKPLGTADGKSDQFDRDKESEFTVNLGDVGQIYKIRLEHDNSNNFPSWHVDKVLMTDKHTGQELKFYVDRWLAEDEDDGSLCRELVPVEKLTRPVLHYYVVVLTGNTKEAGTTASVSLTMYGQYGDSGKRMLLDSRTHNIKFLHGQADVFIVEAVHLGSLEKIVLEHDGKDKDSAWFVDKVVIKETEHALQEYTFSHSEWLEPHRGHPAQAQIPCSSLGLASPLPDNELVSQRPDHPTQGKWTLQSTTNEQTGACMDADVFLTVYGVRCSTEPIRLQDFLEKPTMPAAEAERPQKSREKKKKPTKGKKKEEKGEDKEEGPFQSGHVDTFKLDLGDVGDIFKIRVSLDQRGRNPAWNLKKLKMKDDSTNQEFHFHYDSWLGRGPDSTDYVVELPAIRPDIAPQEEMSYIVSVTTGNVPWADTEATILCTLVGDLGDTGQRPLLTAINSDTKFQTDQTDVFEIRALDLGSIQKVIMEHNRHGRGRGWFCEKATVRVGEQAEVETIFPCHRWLDTGCEDRALKRVLLPLATVKTAPEPSNKKLKSKGRYKCLLGTAANDDDEGNSNNNNNKNGNADGNVNNNNGNADGNVNNNSNGRGGGEDGKEKRVTVTVYGEKGVKHGVELDNGSNQMFVPGTQDEFELNVGDIGEIFKIRVNNEVENDADAVWDVNEVTLLDQDTKENLSFDFSSWVGQPGITSCELPAIRPGRDIPHVIDYIITVTTAGDEDDDLTVEEADVYITLHGNNGDSGKRHLLRNKENKPKFQPGQSETFSISAVDLGTIHQVTMHNTPDPDPWHLKTVVVKAGEYAPSESVFHYDQTIEGPTVELMLTKTSPSEVAVPSSVVPYLPRSNGVWKVWTRTGDKAKMNVSSTVLVTMCGDKQESKPHPLVANDSDTPFMPGETDEFLVRLDEDIGDLVKMRLSLTDKTKKSSWFLQEITFQDQDTHDEFTTEVNDWISVDDEHDGIKEISAVWPGTQTLPLVMYNVQTVTGSDKNASTNASVYIEIVGEAGATGKRQLKRSQTNERPFQQSQTDHFILECADLMHLQKVWVGHNGKKKGAGWFLESVTISRETDPSQEFRFHCGRWLEKSEDDGALERWLEPSGQPPPTPPPPKQEDTWKVWTTTGRDKQAATRCQVIMVIYCQNGKTADLAIGKDRSNKFQRGKTEEFEVECAPDLGEVYKVRLGFAEDSDPDSSWQCDRVKLQHLDSGATYEFDVRSWLRLSESQDGWLEIPVRESKPEDLLPVHKYEVQIYTGDVSCAGTDASVHLTLHGERGDSGRRLLLKSLNHPSRKFEQANMDVFEIEAVDLLDLRMAVVGHDGHGAGNGWFLDRIVVRKQAGDAKKWVFPCSRWLDEGEDDGKIERKLKVKQGIPWRVQTVSSEKSPSCPGPATLVIYGERGHSEPFQIGTAEDFLFGAAQHTDMDTFQVEVEYPEDVSDLGELYKVRVGFEVPFEGEELQWNLEKVVLWHLTDSLEYEFELNDWVRVQEYGDSWREVTVKRSNKEDELPVHNYWVEVYTSDRGGAGTDAQVYIQIFGERGDTGIRKLLRSHEPGSLFEAAKKDTFEVEAVDMLDLTKVLVGHDGKGVGAGWHLEKIIIGQAKDAKSKYLFKCNRWFDEGEDDGETERVLELTEIISDEDDEDWRVWATTGKHKQAGCGDGQLVLALYGENGQSEDISLGEDKDRKKIFTKGKTDEFQVKVKANIGKLYKVRVGFAEADLHKKPSWQLDTLKLQRLKTGEVYEFEYRSWIQVTSDHDGWTEIVPRSDNLAEMLPSHKYQVEVYTGQQSSSGTDAHVYLTICGERGDTGRRHLWKNISSNKRNFEQGNVDVFEVEAVDLAALKKVIVGHDGTEDGSGWFLDKIVIWHQPEENPDAKNKFVFRCDRWLDKGEDDGKIERELAVKERVPWKIWTHTSEKEGEEEPGCEGPATLVLYGEKGQSEPFNIGVEEGFAFACDGPEDELQAEVEYLDDLEDLGLLYKVRVGFNRDSDEEEVSWKLLKLKLKNLNTGEIFEFELNDWIRLIPDVSDSWCELPIWKEEEDKDGDNEDEDKVEKKSELLSVNKYWVEVFTADKAGAATDANVYLQIFGERGDTGVRKLLQSHEPGTKFEAGRLDVFEVEAVDLKDLTRVVVGHDGKDHGAGWYLNKIIIGETQDADRKFLFECDKWLDKGEDDGLIERDLKLTEVLEDIKDGDWSIFVITSSEENAGTLGQVTLTIFGENGDTGPLPLGEPASGLFEREDADQFDIYVDPEDIGQFMKIRVEHDARKPGEGWKLDRIVMQNRVDEEQVVEFEVNRWLDVAEDDGDVVRELAVEWPGQEPLPVTKYLVETETGKQGVGDSETEVYIILHGEKGDSGKRYLSRNKEGTRKFGKGQIDRFELEAIDLGDLEKVTVGHNGEGSESAWYLNQVTIKESEDAKEEYIFPCKKWLGKDKGDGEMERELTGTRQPVGKKKDGKKKGKK